MPQFYFTLHMNLSIVLILSTFMLSGCAENDAQQLDSDGGADTETGFDPDSGEDSGADTDDPVDYSCPVGVSLPCPADRIFPGAYDSALSMTNLQGHTLVNASLSLNMALGFAPNNGGPRLIIVQNNGTGPSLLFITPSSEDGTAALEPRDVVTLPEQECRDNEMEYPTAVLGCAAVAMLCGSESCHLYCLHTDENGLIGELTPMEGGQVPMENPVAMAGVRSIPAQGGGFDRIYVAGDGVAAFNGQTWQEQVAAGQARFADIASGEENGETSYVVAAGEKGALYTDMGGVWHQIDTGVDYDFTGAGALDNKWGASGGALAASGAAGFVLFRDGVIKTCPLPGLPVSHVFVRADFTGADPPGVAVTAYTEFGQVIEAWSAASGNVFNACLSDSGFEGAALIAGPSYFGADAYFSFLATTDNIYYRVELGIGP